MKNISHRRLTLKECVALRQAARRLPLDATSFQIWKHLRDEILIRLLYETSMSVGDLLNVRVEDMNLPSYSICLEDPGVITRTEEAVIVGEVGFVIYSEATLYALIRYLAGRKRGHLITNNREERMSVRTAERIVDEYAKLARIQRIRGYTFDKDGRKRALKVVTCRSLSEARRERANAPSAVSGSERPTVKRFVKIKRKLQKRAPSEV